MLVTMIVFSLAITMVYVGLTRMLGLTKDLESTADSVSEVRMALAQIDRQVRSGNVLFSPAQETLTECLGDAAQKSGTCMRIYTQSNGANRCVQWQVLEDPNGVRVRDTSGHPTGNSWMVRMRSWHPDWSTNNQYTKWTVQAQGLNPIVKEEDYPFRLPVGTTDYGSRLAEIKFEAYDDRRPGKPVVIDSSLSGRNTNYGYDGGLCNALPPA
jgi:hypothetical protein